MIPLLLAYLLGRVPVVVELFSSEGCSSCPAADTVLDRLDREQPVANAEVIALEMHVDYWNYLGWRDPFSSAAMSERQHEYARAMGRDGIYTPQAVVDGQRELVGSDEAALRAAIAKAAERPHTKVILRRAGDRVTVEVTPSGAGEIWLAITERGLVTQVARGENGGRRLGHAPVVRSLRRLTATAGRASAPLELQPGWSVDRLRAVAFVQDPRTRRITGAAALDLRAR